MMGMIRQNCKQKSSRENYAASSSGGDDSSELGAGDSARLGPNIDIVSSSFKTA